MDESRSFWEKVGVKIYQSARQTLSFLAHLPGKFLFGIENYLRSRMREIPGPPPESRHKVVEKLLQDPSLQTTLQQYSQETGFSPVEMEKKVADHLREIASELNYLSFPLWDILLSWVFNKIYEGLNVDEEGIERLRNKVGKAPILFIPNHRSHTDYLLLSYIFYYRRLPMPLVCGGINLNFWPIGPIFRRGGAFFIRRSFEGYKLYSAALKAYIKYIISENALIELFIEGTRSRTGKLLRPRMGILSYVIQAYLEGAAPDVILVPTSFTYESVLEEKSYIREQEGGSKKDENVSSLFSLRQYLKRRTGKVYIQFSEPLSLKELAEEIGTEDRKNLTEQVALQVTYGINKVTVATATALTAMALLSHHQKAVPASSIEEKIDFYIRYLATKGDPPKGDSPKVASPTGCRLSEPLLKNRKGAVREALNKYLNAGMIRQYHDEEGTFYVVEELRRPLLDYYKNSSIHFFISLSCLSTILCTIGKNQLLLSDVEKEFRSLQEMFRHEFTFSRRHPIKDHLEKVLVFFEKEEWLKVADNQVTLTETGSRAIEPMSRILQNYFESYFIAWKGLNGFFGKTVEEKELVNYLRGKGLLLLLKEKVKYRESLSAFNLRNALSFFKDLGIIEEIHPPFKKKFQHFLHIKKEEKRYETLGVRLSKYITIH
ncbi:MAG: 1-acyl-sn-glycerol-3-phosphate acyltransferase [Deltaproteobacteria bacterium]|nr:1-acyl-sn-glycerol-3-phosphate acyltransferase [Deltaproteobacteria bacterium]